MEKLVRNGLVAVAVSYEYGGGWSTWNSVNPLDKRFNALFDEGKHIEAAKLCEALDLGHSGGAATVELVWLEPGTEFRITEYDGWESLELASQTRWLRA